MRQVKLVGAMNRDKDLVEKNKNRIEKQSTRSEIDAFIRQTQALSSLSKGAKRGRLIFAMDATMSRQPTWDRACALQVDMFATAANIGGLDVQLVYFRGFGECRASGWVDDAHALSQLMAKIDCRGGHTQIRKILQHAYKAGKKDKIAALVYVGDAMEENIDDLAAISGQLGLLGVKAFMFLEGNDAIADKAFREISRLTGGAFCRFDSGSAQQLGELLRAVAAYAAGGFSALKNMRGQQAQVLLEQIR